MNDLDNIEKTGEGQKKMQKKHQPFRLEMKIQSDKLIIKAWSNTDYFVPYEGELLSYGLINLNKTK